MKGKYLLRRIPYASHESFNPFVISNKQARIVNRNCEFVPKNQKKHPTVTESPLGFLWSKSLCDVMHVIKQDCNCANDNFNEGFPF